MLNSCPVLWCWFTHTHTQYSGHLYHWLPLEREQQLDSLILTAAMGNQFSPVGYLSLSLALSLGLSLALSLTLSRFPSLSQRWNKQIFALITN